jgi:23S rRNA (guanosine2251-2'-O)-methyltransferase
MGAPGTLHPESTIGPVLAGAALIYGRNPVREALRGRRKVSVVWVATGVPGDDLGHVLGQWLAAGSGSDPDVRQASPLQLTSLAGSPDHQGIVAAVEPFPYVEPEAILKDFTLLVALDEVQDPHNLGAIIRTAEGAGAGIVIPRHRAAEVTAAVVKASAGATEHAAIAQVRNLADFLIAAKDAGFWVYGAAAGATSAYSAQDYRYPTCFVVGSEGQGLGRRVESLCDVMVSLPLQGKVDSLNVSVSTGILLYEAVRQRMATAAGAPAESQAAAPDAAAPNEPAVPQAAAPVPRVPSAPDTPAPDAPAAPEASPSGEPAP